MAKTKAAEMEELKELALSIVRAQTNVYVKELLRAHGVRIGATKSDFDRNLLKAIDNEVLTREHFEEWLQQVEGWGEQHVYAYRLTEQLKRDFTTEELARKRVEAARLSKYWRKPTATTAHLDFSADEKLSLVSITYADSLLFHWHKGTQYWVRSKDEEQHDKPREWIDGFEYEFRAYRGRAMREVMRFEVRPSDGLAAMFVPKPINSKEHKAAYEQVRKTIDRVLNFSTLEGRRLAVGDIIKNLDQKLAFDADAAKEIRPRSTRLRSGDAYVEFSALSQEGSYFDSGDVLKLRSTLRTDADIGVFEGAAGTFRFGNQGRVELFADDRRIRLWSSLTAAGVWSILRVLRDRQ